MKKTLNLNDFEQLRVIADPLRRKLFEVFCGQPVTTKQAASILGEKPTKLYHHVDSLEKAGFIKLIRTRQNRGTVERYYQAVARTLAIDRKLLNYETSAGGQSSEVANLLLDALEDSVQNLIQSVNNGLLIPSDEKRVATLIKGKLFINKTKLVEFHQLLEGWLKDNSSDSETGKELHELTIAIYPVQATDKKTAVKPG